MKKLLTATIILITLIVTFSSCSKDDNLESKDIKRYNVESGIIKYVTTISGTVASGTVNGSGTSQLYFENWGAKELENEQSTTTTVVIIPISNQKITDVSTTHNTYKIDNEMIYTVDYDTKTIFTKSDPLIELMRLNDYDALEAGRKMLISMGGTQSENEEFKGYDCEIWTALGSKQWIYKGITLKIVSTIGGIITTQEATDIKFDVSVNESYFKLPDYTHKNIDEL
ncbi:hypothetical protein [Tenacibaculum piscium]|uniref:hypothetical protein n=1 Tax=Tenacibaculum piscium TaxID=1458515 RepID=UPI001EFAB6D9|nr:hypothetical protein [Tenacibaculum piscium]MCG8183907.1 hypothetical protein [Tenacibaculum piscium]MCG8205167.1 hypothetical protein [Tenacibaculum piscium]